MKLVFSLLAAFVFLYLALYTAGNLALYQTFPHFDKVMHFIGGFFSSWIVLSYAAHVKRTTPKLSTILFATLIVGILWEIAEYSTDIYLKGTRINHYFGGGGPFDSFTDVITNLLGASTQYSLVRKLHSFQRLNAQKAQATFKN